MFSMMFSRYKLAVVLLAAAAPALAGPESEGPQAHPIPPQSGFVLSVDELGPGSAALLRGDYDAAIEAAQRANRLGRSLSAELTLCAAHIGRNSLDEAVSACDRAVDSAQSQITTLRNPHGHTNRLGLAKAYSNRGILRVLRGELQAAAADFAKALRQQRHTAVVAHNARRGQALSSVARAN